MIANVPKYLTAPVRLCTCLKKQKQNPLNLNETRSLIIVLRVRNSSELEKHHIKICTVYIIHCGSV